MTASFLIRGLRRAACAASLFVSLSLMGTGSAAARLQSGEVHVWELQEITLATARDYANPYTEVECWIELEGPAFKRRVYGFWDGGRAFKVRFVATRPGDWSWHVASNQPADAGLAGAGRLRAVAWSGAEIAQNPNR